MSAPIFFAPKLVIFEPKDNFSAKEDKVTIIGETDPKSVLTINKMRVYNDSGGKFQETMDIALGLNTFTVKAVNRFGKENVKILRVVRE